MNNLNFGPIYFPRPLSITDAVTEIKKDVQVLFLSHAINVAEQVELRNSGKQSKFTGQLYS